MRVEDAMSANHVRIVDVLASHDLQKLVVILILIY